MYHFESPLVDVFVFYNDDSLSQSLFATQQFSPFTSFFLPFLYIVHRSLALANHSRQALHFQHFTEFKQSGGISSRIYGRVMCRYYHIDSKIISTDAENARFQVLIVFFYPFIAFTCIA